MSWRTLRTVGFALVLGTAAGAGIAADSQDALVALGRKLFFDPALSGDGRFACASCHDPKFAYGPPPGYALGLPGRPLGRAVPSLRYLRAVPAFAPDHRFLDGDTGPIGGFSWDGRSASLREQTRSALLADDEMANRDAADVAGKLAHAAYAGEFRAAFGDAVFAEPGRAFDAALDALGAFQGSPAEFFPYTSRYDAFLRGELELSEREERGVALFKDPKKGNCASCHTAMARAGMPPNFTDFDFANEGVPRNARIAANADPAYFDLGLCGPRRGDLREQRRYCGMFRAPSLRNVAVRDAFFHNGVFASLRDAVRFYVDRDLRPEAVYPRDGAGKVRTANDLPPGVPFNLDRDPPFDRKPGSAPALTDAEIDDLVAFLETLSDADVKR